MTTIVTRSGKAAPLTNTELDANFTNLNTDKLEKGSNLSDLQSVSQARTNLGLGDLATQNKASLAGPVALTDSSTSPALKITQTGTGNALVVEDAASDSTPFVIDQNGNVGVGVSTAFANNKLSVAGGTDASTWLVRSSADVTGYEVRLLKNRNTNVYANTVVNAYDVLGAVSFGGNDGANYQLGASIQALVDGTPGPSDMPGRLVFSTTPDNGSTPTERMRIDSGGRVGIGSAPYAGVNVITTQPITGNVVSSAFTATGTVQSDVTNRSDTFISYVGTQAATFTLGNLRHFGAYQATIGAGSTVTNQHGFFADAGLVGATNNYGFYGNIPAGTGRYNFYAAGTADNYFAGRVIDSGGIAQTPTRSAVASGSTISLTTATNHLLYDQSATVAALTVTLPSSGLVDGQIITIATRSAITALTVNGGTIYGAPTTLAAGGFASFIYSSGATAWFRKG